MERQRERCKSLAQIMEKRGRFQQQLQRALLFLISSHQLQCIITNFNEWNPSSPLFFFLPKTTITATAPPPPSAFIVMAIIILIPVSLLSLFHYYCCLVPSLMPISSQPRSQRGRGSNGNETFPSFVEDNRVHYNNNMSPQLQLFANVPIQCGAGVGTINHIGNNHPVNRVRGGETFSMQQKLHISLNNNFCQDEAGRIGTVLNPNPVSTGLKLSNEGEEHNSSVTSACENMKNNVPVMLSLDNTVKMEIDRQTEEFGRYIKLQEENILKGAREINQRHTVSLLNALEKGVKRKLQEKDLEIVNMNRKNKELGDRIKQVAMEAQSWLYRARYNESVVNVLKSNIQQLIEQGTVQAREGCGDSEVDDTLSSSNHQRIASTSRTEGPQSHPPSPRCRACSCKEVSVLILPCRHLCLCTDCEGLVEVCPVCQVLKTASVHVYM